MKKWEKKIAKVIEATAFERDATICQYLIAECFVKSILGYQCQSQRKDIQDIAQVVLKRLTIIDNTDIIKTQNDDRIAQQMRLLADTVACWIAEILVEVAETRKEDLKEYCEKRQMKMMEVEERDDDQIKDEDWKEVKEEKKIIDETVQKQDAEETEDNAKEIKIKDTITEEDWKEEMKQEDIIDEAVQKENAEETKDNNPYKIKIEDAITEKVQEDIENTDITENIGNIDEKADINVKNIDDNAEINVPDTEDTNENIEYKKYDTE